MEHAGIDVAHLSFKPPFAPGSNNRTMARFIERTPTLRQVMVSFWDGEAPLDNPLRGEHRRSKTHWRDYTVLVNREQLPRWKRAYLRTVPAAVRRRILWRGADRRYQIYNWRAAEVVRRLRPRVVVCYDMHGMGRLMREATDGSCRTVLAQRGLSYHLSHSAAQRVYATDAFDIVWNLSHAAYRRDRARMSHYEPGVRVIPNCVDTTRFRPTASSEERREVRRQWGLPEGKKVVLFLARLAPKKGAHLLIEAWPRVLEKHPEALLWVAGGGETSYRRRLERLVKALGVEGTVRFEGRVAGEDTPACYRAADVYAFPTLANEGMSLSLLEAMASGLPCVTASHPVAREHYAEEEVRFVEDPNLEDAFAAPLVDLFARPRHRQRFAQSARQAACERFSYEAVFPEIERFLKRQVCLAG